MLLRGWVRSLELCSARGAAFEMTVQGREAQAVLLCLHHLKHRQAQHVIVPRSKPVLAPGQCGDALAKSSQQPLQLDGLKAALVSVTKIADGYGHSALL